MLPPLSGREGVSSSNRLFASAEPPRHDTRRHEESPCCKASIETCRLRGHVSTRFAGLGLDIRNSHWAVDDRGDTGSPAVHGGPHLWDQPWDNIRHTMQYQSTPAAQETIGGRTKSCGDSLCAFPSCNAT